MFSKKLIKKIKLIPKLFHNIYINVRPTEVRLEDIYFWSENYRTVLSLDLLTDKFRRPLEKISLEEIVTFLSKQKVLKIKKLANSILRNGVRVPLIIIEDGTLLDGNRRYFACCYLREKAREKEEERPAVLDAIPVWIIDRKDSTPRNRKKILAEANFVDDCKIEWTLDVKAKVVYDYYRSCIKQQNMDKEQAYGEILDVYSVDRETAEAYVGSMKLVKKFVKSAKKNQRNRYRQIVQEKFVYFWEFLNKTSIKKIGLDPKKELPKLKGLFFTMMATDRFDNYKQIEPMVRAIRDKYMWELLEESSGTKINQVEALYKERKAIMSAEDKVRSFLNWLTDKAKPSSFTRATFVLLNKLIRACRNIIEKHKES